jgi:hypothetical protein
MTVVKEKRLTQRLADQFRYRTMMGQRDYRVEEEERLGKVSHIRRTLKLDIERARFVTQAYKENDGDPIVIRRAKAMANHLDVQNLVESWFEFEDVQVAQEGLFVHFSGTTLMSNALVLLGT